MISRPKACNQFLFLVHKVKQYSSSCAKYLALTLWRPLKKKNRHTISPQTHIVFIMARSKKGFGRCHKSGPGKIRVGGEPILVINRALIATTVTQISKSCHHQCYLFIFHWIIQSSIHLSCPRFVNSHPVLHLTVLVITNALIAITLTQKTMICCHWWYLGFLHGMIN